MSGVGGLLGKMLFLGLLLVASMVCLGLSRILAGGRTERTGYWFVLLTAGACLVTLALSAVPGLLAPGFVVVWLALLLGSFLIAAVLIGLVVLLVRWHRKQADGSSSPTWGFTVPKVTLWFAILFATYALGSLGVPRRIGFAASRHAFEALVDGAPVREYGGAKLDRRLGIYHVDEYATDPRGGVYFRVHTGRDMIDTISYGFVYRPNEIGSPFGGARYRITEISDGWFAFSVSDDWY